MSYYKNKPPFGYRIFTRDVWFDFNMPKYLLGKYCVLEFIDTKYVCFKMYQN
jgi:hypothetical protein